MDKEEIKKAKQAASNWHNITFFTFEPRFKNFSDDLADAVRYTFTVLDNRPEKDRPGKVVETTARKIPDEEEIRKAVKAAQKRLLEKGDEIWGKTGEK